MASANDLSTLNGMFKETYANKIENLIPDGVKLINEIKFASRDKQPGNLYHQPVVLGLEHGVTFGGAGDGAFNLNAPIAGVMQDATVRGNQMVLRSVLSYSAASRSVSGGNKAFEDATKYLVKNMMNSMSKKLEIEMLYGQMGYATVASTSGNVITITTAEWAPGIWSGAEGMPLEIRDSTGATIRGSCNVSAVDLSARTVTVDSMPAGVSASDVIWHKGAYGNEFAGIHKIITNSSSLFGISAASYNLWKGNSFSAGSAALSFAKIQDAIALAVEKGLDSKVMVLVNPKAWADLLTEQTALRMYDSSYKSSELEQGSQKLKFFGQNGEIEIVPSIYIKEGYAYVICPDEFLRVGSTDVTFRRPGQGDEFFKDLENAAGYELRAYTDQALFCFAPGKNTLITAITN